MRFRILIPCVLAFSWASCIGGSMVWGDVIEPITFTMTPDATHNNQVALTLKITLFGLSESQTQSSLVTGSFNTNLDLAFDGSNQATVTGIGFVPKTAPGNLSFSDVSFFSGDVTSSGLKGDFSTSSPPTVVSGGAFSTLGGNLLVNGGILNATSLGTTLNFGDSPESLPFGDNTASIVVSAPSIVGNLATYNVTLLLPADVPMTAIPTTPASVSASGTIRATASFTETIPEPGTLVMLLGLAVGLAGCGWLRRRS